MWVALLLFFIFYFMTGLFTNILFIIDYYKRKDKEELEEKPQNIKKLQE